MRRSNSRPPRAWLIFFTLACRASLASPGARRWRSLNWQPKERRPLNQRTLFVKGDVHDSRVEDTWSLGWATLGPTARWGRSGSGRGDEIHAFRDRQAADHLAVC